MSTFPFVLFHGTNALFIARQDRQGACYCNPGGVAFHAAGEVITTAVSTADRLIAHIQKFSQAKIAVIGDLMIDEFIYGSAGRISPEAPVPVVTVIEKKHRLGGAVLRRPRLVIECPAAMLYDIPYPGFLRELAARFDGSPEKWEVFDFEWNRPLYD